MNYRRVLPRGERRRRILKPRMCKKNESLRPYIQPWIASILFLSHRCGTNFPREILFSFITSIHFESRGQPKRTVLLSIIVMAQTPNPTVSHLDKSNNYYCQYNFLIDQQIVASKSRCRTLTQSVTCPKIRDHIILRSTRYHLNMRHGT